MLLDKKHIHFVGIGGIGMSGIAQVLSKTGYSVSGSDLHLNELTKRLERMGAKIHEGHRPSNIPADTDIVVYSSSVPRDNPELVEAEKREIPVVQRAAVLGELLDRKKGIAIAGTHGKTTTTALISCMLEETGLDPTVIIGGEVDRFGGNAKLGKGPYLVAEADESDGSFLHLHPFYSVITNIEMEHLDYYRTLEDVLYSYTAFVNNIKKDGAVFYNHGDTNVRKVIEGSKGIRRESFGISKNADMHPLNIDMTKFKTIFDCVHGNRLLGKVELNIPGLHNVLNSLASISVGLNLGLKFDEIVNSIKDFKGTKRRFELKVDTNGVMLIDDYAHHPTEIRAVLDACRNWKDKRLIVIFQPHRYTRTLYLEEDFGRCFKGADILILTDIYAASEEPIEGVSVKNIYDRVKADGLRNAVMVKKDDIVEYVMRLKRPGDMILALGAGDIKEIADELAAHLNKEKILV